MNDTPFRDAIVRVLEGRAEACFAHADGLNKSADRHTDLGAAFAALAARVTAGDEVDAPTILSVLEGDLNDPVAVAQTLNLIGVATRP